MSLLTSVGGHAVVTGTAVATPRATGVIEIVIPLGDQATALRGRRDAGNGAAVIAADWKADLERLIAIQGSTAIIVKRSALVCYRIVSAVRPRRLARVARLVAIATVGVVCDVSRGFRPTHMDGCPGISKPVGIDIGVVGGAIVVRAVGIDGAILPVH